MQLQPRRQPGRTDRKAAAYVPEILRLRAEGYTYEAIREALVDVGIELSTSALRRELRRSRHGPDDASSGMRSASRLHAAAARSTPPPPPARLPSVDGSSSRELAESFFNAHPSNPLLRAKEAP